MFGLGEWHEMLALSINGQQVGELSLDVLHEGVGLMVF